MNQHARPFLAALAALATSALFAATARAEDPGKIKGPMKLDESATFPLENGCHYTAKVKGLVVPAGGTAAEQKLNPNVTINATVSCPNAVDKKVSETVVHTGMTKDEMLDTLSIHGSVLSGATGQRCVYMPLFQLTPENKIDLNGVTYLCPLPPGQGKPAP